MIYLDYAASTPVDDNVLDLFYNISKKYYANPNSFHKLGIEEKKLIDLSLCRMMVGIKYYVNYITSLPVLP